MCSLSQTQKSERVRVNEREGPFGGGQIVRISNGFPAPRQDKHPLGTPLGGTE